MCDQCVKGPYISNYLPAMYWTIEILENVSYEIILKLEGIKYNVTFNLFVIQNYLLSEELSVQLRKLLTHLRCRMTKARADYTKMYESNDCQLCHQNGEFFDFFAT